MSIGLDAIAGSLGIVGVAQQLLQSILKIAAFCEDVKDAPVETKDTIDSIENTGRILIRLSESDAESSRASSNEDVFWTSFELFKKALERVAVLAIEMGREIATRRHRGGF